MLSFQNMGLIGGSEVQSCLAALGRVEKYGHDIGDGRFGPRVATNFQCAHL